MNNMPSLCVRVCIVNLEDPSLFRLHTIITSQNSRSEKHKATRLTWNGEVYEGVVSHDYSQDRARVLLIEPDSHAMADLIVTVGDHISFRRLNGRDLPTLVIPQDFTRSEPQSDKKVLGTYLCACLRVARDLQLEASQRPRILADRLVPA